MNHFVDVQVSPKQPNFAHGCASSSSLAAAGSGYAGKSPGSSGAGGKFSVSKILAFDPDSVSRVGAGAGGAKESQYQQHAEQQSSSSASSFPLFQQTDDDGPVRFCSLQMSRVSVLQEYRQPGLLCTSQNFENS
jgi:hypothetical protein